MKIALTFNLKRDEAVAAGCDVSPRPPDFYAECDSPETVGALHSALASRGDTVVDIEADSRSPLRLMAERPDLVFNVAEGLVGPSREALLPAVCELLSLPYTGSDPFTLALTLDKAKTNDVLAAARLPVARHVVVRSPAESARAAKTVGFPAIVKPLHEGSSKGITNSRVVRGPKALRAQVAEVCSLYQQPALVERFLPGREFTVALLGNPPELRALPIVEIDLSVLPPEANAIYSYEAKWVWDTPSAPLAIFECPARVPARMADRLSGLAKDVFGTLGCRDWARIDLRCDGSGRPHVLEVNPLPGILPDPADNSCYPKAARAAGMRYAAMIQAVVDAACARLGIARTQTAPVPPARRVPAERSPAIRVREAAALR